MNPRRLTLRIMPIIVTGALLLACGDAPLEPVDGISHAVATPSCGPADEPITAIYLAPTPVELPQPVSPFVQAHLPRAPAELTAGDEFRIGETFQDAIVWFYLSGLDTRLASHGEIGITAVDASDISGYVDLKFDDGTKLRGSFKARLTPRVMLCG
jgi:hypothetical protein